MSYGPPLEIGYLFSAFPDLESVFICDGSSQRLWSPPPPMLENMALSQACARVVQEAMKLAAAPRYMISFRGDRQCMVVRDEVSGVAIGALYTTGATGKSIRRSLRRALRRWRGHD